MLLSADGGGVQVVNEARMPTVIRELKSVLPQRPLSVDEGEIDRSLADDSLVSYASPASQNVDRNTMLGAVNRIADVSLMYPLTSALISLNCFNQ